MEYHSIRGSWDFNRDSLDGDVSNGEIVAADTEDVGVGPMEEIGGEPDDEDALAWPDLSVPGSPDVSDFTDDGSQPLASDVGSEFMDGVDDEVEVMDGPKLLKRKCLEELGAESTARWKVARREETGIASDDGSEAGTDGGRGQSRSAMARKRLNKLAGSGKFVVDEKKRERFEKRCLEVDRGAKFQYQGAGWRVLHSKCLKWYRMSEPYNAAKFRAHLETCKARGEGRNLSITSFFKPRDSDSTGAEAKITIAAVSGRKQIFVGGSASTSPSEPPHIDNGLTTQNHPCCGISDTHNPLVSTYISRAVVEGAGSISIHAAAKMIFGDGAKYSELSKDQKATVTIAQSHLRTWTISRELHVVFSTGCEKFIEQDRLPKTICGNCEKVLQSDSFKRALRVKPVPLKNMKYIPARYRGPLEDLGAKFANIQGLPELLQDVSSLFDSTQTAIKVSQDPQTSMWLRFARGAINGEYDDKYVLLAMIQATVMAHDRESRGVGLQNMSYLPVYEEFTQMVALTSPRTYRLFSSHIQLPSLRRQR